MGPVVAPKAEKHLMTEISTQSQMCKSGEWVHHLMLNWVLVQVLRTALPGHGSTVLGSVCTPSAPLSLPTCHCPSVTRQVDGDHVHFLSWVMEFSKHGDWILADVKTLFFVPCSLPVWCSPEKSTRKRLLANDMVSAAPGPRPLPGQKTLKTNLEEGVWQVWHHWHVCVCVWCVCVLKYLVV